MSLPERKYWIVTSEVFGHEGDFPTWFEANAKAVELWGRGDCGLIQIFGLNTALEAGGTPEVGTYGLMDLTGGRPSDVPRGT